LPAPDAVDDPAGCLSRKKRKDNHMSPVKQKVPDGSAESRPGHTRSGGEPMEPSTTEVSAQGPSLRSRAPATVADITRPSPVTVGEYDHVAAAAYLMKHAGSAALMVLGSEHGNRPVGMITETDIAAAVADGMDVNETRIHDLLTGRPAAILAATSIRDAARIMVNGRFRQLAVTDGTGWMGIVDIADVCGALLEPLAA
jgi:CBS domain-containing protein